MVYCKSSSNTDIIIGIKVWSEERRRDTEEEIRKEGKMLGREPKNKRQEHIPKLGVAKEKMVYCKSSYNTNK